MCLRVPALGTPNPSSSTWVPFGTAAAGTLLASAPSKDASPSAKHGVVVFERYRATWRGPTTGSARPQPFAGGEGGRSREARRTAARRARGRPRPATRRQQRRREEGVPAWMPPPEAAPAAHAHCRAGCLAGPATPRAGSAPPPPGAGCSEAHLRRALRILRLASAPSVGEEHGRRQHLQHLVS